MKLELKNIPEKILAVWHRSKRYARLAFFVAVIGIMGFMVYQINAASTAEPTEDQKNEKFLEVKRPRIDEEAVKRIQELEERNVEVQALFDEARNNPFQD